MTNESLVSVYQAAKQLDKHPQTLYYWIKKGMPVHWRATGLTKRMVIDMDELHRWLNEQQESRQA